MCFDSGVMNVTAQALPETEKAASAVRAARLLADELGLGRAVSDSPVAVAICHEIGQAMNQLSALGRDLIDEQEANLPPGTWVYPHRVSYDVGRCLIYLQAAIARVERLTSLVLKTEAAKADSGPGTSQNRNAGPQPGKLGSPQGRSKTVEPVTSPAHSLFRGKVSLRVSADGKAPRRGPSAGIGKTTAHSQIFVASHRQQKPAAGAKANPRSGVRKEGAKS